MSKFTSEYVMEPVKSARTRFTFSTPEFWLFLAGVLTTISWIFGYFTTLGAAYPSIGLDSLMKILSQIMVYITYGFIIYLLAVLSLYFDEKYRLASEEVLSSNFNFTRLITPIARAFVLLIALYLITGTNILPISVPYP